jgi:hypothetical protein
MKDWRLWTSLILSILMSFGMVALAVSRIFLYVAAVSRRAVCGGICHSDHLRVAQTSHIRQLCVDVDRAVSRLVPSGRGVEAGRMDLLPDGRADYAANWFVRAATSYSGITDPRRRPSK